MSLPRPARPAEPTLPYQKLKSNCELKHQVLIKLYKIPPLATSLARQLDYPFKNNLYSSSLMSLLRLARPS